MSTGIVATLVLTQRNGIKFEDLVEKFSWLKELIIQKGTALSCSKSILVVVLFLTRTAQVDGTTQFYIPITTL